MKSGRLQAEKDKAIVAVGEAIVASDPQGRVKRNSGESLRKRIAMSTVEKWKVQGDMDDSLT